MFPFVEYFGGSGKFRRDYRCYSCPSNRKNVEHGGKVILPSSALDILSRMNVQFPMLFKITNSAKAKSSHCGVLEFVAEEGRIYLPSWMMKNLCLNDGDVLSVESCTLPIATFSKFQPVSSDFLDITDPRAVLERGLRGFACLTSGDAVAIEYNEKIFELIVLETQPAEAVSIIECDMQVDFVAPLDYKEPKSVVKNSSAKEKPILIDANDIPGVLKFLPFEGAGRRLGGTKRKNNLETAQDLLNTARMVDVATISIRGIPNYNWRPGLLTFRRCMQKSELPEQARMSLYQELSKRVLRPCRITVVKKFFLYCV
ncbi:ubiquitin recognition factor in ER-associated degradation protein 1-like isoform X1 [Paramacrobiotus metropolitanus]|uniref:ubiquitin recognition factor in ER-associated degradation protein 1-like isoform X1 n=1 Tax=Paramacrobiotus metropolitanus TaxID=2943436 RepID=UPI002445775A|nr:ubiquitin recognition factor in ER-associated degradation protein 1-like isoform X1 [Paramacrobiotus metropolitanus]